MPWDPVLGVCGPAEEVGPSEDKHELLFFLRALTTRLSIVNYPDFRNEIGPIGLRAKHQRAKCNFESGITDFWLSNLLGH